MPVSTRMHGLIDYAAALSLGGLVLTGALSGRARRVAAIATAVPVACFLNTDFEGGIARRISVPQHLKFDVGWGALLAAAGLLMRRQSAASRTILTFYGVAQCMLGLNTVPTPQRRPGQGSGPLDRLNGPI